MGFVNDLRERFALNAYALGRYDRAVSWLRRLEAAEGQSSRVLRNLGVALLASGNVEEAERYFLREEELYGESRERHRALADLYYSAGLREKALSRYAAALKADDARAPRGEDARYLRDRHDICSDERSFDWSAEAARLFALGEAARDGGKTDEALDLFLRSGKLDATSWPSFNNAGVLMLASGDAERAIDLFKRAYACAPLPTIKNNIDAARAAASAQTAEPARKTARARVTGGIE